LSCFWLILNVLSSLAQMSAPAAAAVADQPEEPPLKPQGSEQKDEHKKEHAGHKEHHAHTAEKEKHHSHHHHHHHHEHTNGGPAGPKRLKVCILQSSYEETTSVFKEVDPYAVPHRWLPDCDVTSVLVRKSTALMQVRDLAKLNFDMYVNLCDGAWDEDRAGIEVVRALERYAAFLWLGFCASEGLESLTRICTVAFYGPVCLRFYHLHRRPCAVAWCQSWSCSLGSKLRRSL
jgi:hypothetical protein